MAAIHLLVIHIGVGVLPAHEQEWCEAGADGVAGRVLDYCRNCFGNAQQYDHFRRAHIDRLVYAAGCPSEKPVAAVPACSGFGGQFGVFCGYTQC